MVFAFLLFSFLLTRLMRGVTDKQEAYLDAYKISTHTPHARRDVKDAFNGIAFGISTHTPHARRDGKTDRNGKKIFDFYSHASCEA